MTQKRITICVPGDNFSGRFLDAWTMFLFELQQRGWAITISRNYSPVVALSRLRCMGGDPRNGLYQSPFAGRDYDYVLWIDSDMVWTVKHFEHLLKSMEETDAEVMTGLYLMADGVRYACVSEWQPEKLGTDDPMEFLLPNSFDDSPFPVGYNGLGFALVKRGVFERLPYPWFCGRESENPLVPISEDVDFCLRCAEAGIKIYVDPRVVVGHEKRMVLKPPARQTSSPDDAS
jgi:hypothetical protein